MVSYGLTTESTENTEEKQKNSVSSVVNKTRKYETDYMKNNNYDMLTEKVIGCAIEVHKALGPGLLESTYEHCLAHEMGLQGMNFKVQVPMPVKYKNAQLDCGYRLDIVVNNCLILELKAVRKLERIHQALLLTYLKLSGIKTGILINFNEYKLINGIKRLVN